MKLIYNYFEGFEFNKICCYDKVSYIFFDNNYIFPHLDFQELNSSIKQTKHRVYGKLLNDYKQQLF